MPTVTLLEEDFVDGSIDASSLLIKCGFAQSRGDARRTIEQGGASVNNEKITDPRLMFAKEQFTDGLVVRKGKKNFIKVVL